MVCLIAPMLLPGGSSEVCGLRWHRRGMVQRSQMKSPLCDSRFLTGRLPSSKNHPTLSSQDLVVGATAAALQRALPCANPMRSSGRPCDENLEGRERNKKEGPSQCYPAHRGTRFRLTFRTSIAPTWPLRPPKSGTISGWKSKL